MLKDRKCFVMVAYKTKIILFGKVREIENGEYFRQQIDARLRQSELEAKGIRSELKFIW